MIIIIIIIFFNTWFLVLQWNIKVVIKGNN